MRRGLSLLSFLLVSACASSCERNLPDTTAAARGADSAKGKELYQRMCAVCHGADGEGYKADDAPRLAQREYLASVSDEFLREAIDNGRRGTTMSAWSKLHGGPLEFDEVNAVIAYIRTWSDGSTAQLDERPVSGDPRRGEKLYADNCAMCHGARGVGGPAMHVGNPDLIKSASDGFLRYAVQKGRPGTKMPGFEQKLGDDGVEDVVTLLRTWQSPASAARPTARPPPLPLGSPTLNPRGPEPKGFRAFPGMTGVDVVHAELQRKARMAFLDARTPSDYAIEHIAGAASVPFYDPSPYIDKLPKDVWLVCYCACPHAESSQLARVLMSKGFKKVTVLDEGLRVWKDRGYPMRGGDKP